MNMKEMVNKIRICMFMMALLLVVLSSSPVLAVNFENNNIKISKNPLKIETSFKSYMDYRTITNETSEQYKLQQQAYTDEKGLRKIDDMYCVALGTYYSEKCGEIFNIELEGGKNFKVIVGDIKSNKHTDTTNKYVPMGSEAGNVVEFIVDIGEISKEAKISGDISCLGFEGNILEIERIIEVLI